MDTKETTTSQTEKHTVTIFGKTIEPRKATILFIAVGIALMLITSMFYQVNSGKQEVSVQRATPSQELVSQPIGQQSQAPSGMGGSGMGGMAGMFNNSEISEETAKRAGELMQKMQADPTNINYLNELAMLFYEAKDYTTMLNFAKRAISITPENSTANYLAASAYSHLGEYQQSVDAYTLSLKENNSPVTRYNLAVLYAKHLNNKEKAKEELEKALEITKITPQLKEEIDELLSTL